MAFAEALAEYRTGPHIGVLQHRFADLECLIGRANDRDPSHPTIDRVRRDDIECREVPIPVNRLTFPWPPWQAAEEAKKCSFAKANIETPHTWPVEPRGLVIGPVLLLDGNKIRAPRETVTGIVEIGRFAPCRLRFHARIA